MHSTVRNFSAAYKYSKKNSLLIDKQSRLVENLHMFYPEFEDCSELSLTSKPAEKTKKKTSRLKMSYLLFLSFFSGKKSLSF